MATANTGFASGGLACKLGALCFYSSSVQVDSFVLRNPPDRKARKRCMQSYLYQKRLTNQANEIVRNTYERAAQCKADFRTVTHEYERNPG